MNQTAYAIDPESRRFELHSATGYYAMAIDANDRLRFVGWGPRPLGHSGPVLQGLGPQRLINKGAQTTFINADEVAAYGDESLREAAMAVLIPQRQPDAGSEAAHLPVRDLRLRYRGHRIGQPGQARAGEPTHGRAPALLGGDWLIIDLVDAAYPFRVECCFRSDPSTDIIERYLILHNEGDQDLTLRHAWAASLQLPIGRYQATSATGAWCAEFGRQCQPLPVGSTILESRSLNTGLVAQPTVFLQKVGGACRTSGETFGAHLAWSGNWRLHMDAGHDQTIRIHLGEHPVDSQRLLAPGASLATPLVLAGRSDGGEEGLRRAFQSFHQQRTMPAPISDRPVLYNSWEASYFALSLDQQIQLARRAAAIGVERFVVDDGWFGGRRHDKAGLGDWFVSPELFPDGLSPLIEEVHGLGMQFGIWFEPEMVNPDSELYRAHPDWVLHFPGAPRLEGRNQLILDFGNPAVVTNIRQQMERFLDAHPVDFIKWDMNRAPNGAGSLAGEGIWRAHVEALHGLMDGLLARYPKLSIQSCSSGGGRIDAAMLARCCQVWTSDNTDALDRVRIQDGYALCYPSAGMECWVTHTVNHQTHRHLPLDLRFAAAMRGVLGIGSSLDALDEDELAEYAHWIAFYKRMRPLVLGGQLHRAAFPEIDDGLSVWQFTNDDGSEAYVNAIATTHIVGRQCPQYRLADLQAAATYAVSNAAGDCVLRATGAELMGQGLGGTDADQDLANKPGACWHYHLSIEA